jgi:hypothetical protein
MFKKLLILFGLLNLQGCNENDYRDAVLTSVWPVSGPVQYRIVRSAGSTLGFEYVVESKTSPIGLGTKKLSYPLLEKVKFSKDGRYAFIPVQIDSLLEKKSSYLLYVWDIQKRVVSAQGALLEKDIP